MPRQLIGPDEQYITTYKIFPANNQAVLSLVGMLAPATANAVSFFFGRMGDSFGFKVNRPLPQRASS